MGQLTIDTTHNVSLDYELASLGDRILAYIVDTLIRYAYLFLLIVIIGMIADNAIYASSDNDTLAIILVIIVLLPYFFYHFLFEVFNHGQSPGKRVMNIRVVALDGDQVSVRSYFLRWLFRLIDINILTGVVAIIAIGVSERNQRLGDMVAGTTLVKERPTYSLGSLAYTETPKSNYAVTYPQVIRLTSQHIELIKDTLGNQDVADINTHVAVLADKIASIMKVNYTEHPRKFLRTVTRDHSHVQSQLT